MATPTFTAAITGRTGAFEEVRPRCRAALEQVSTGEQLVCRLLDSR
jgi:hypothetical protein